MAIVIAHKFLQKNLISTPKFGLILTLILAGICTFVACDCNEEISTEPHLTLKVLFPCAVSLVVIYRARTLPNMYKCKTMDCHQNVNHECVCELLFFENVAILTWQGFFFLIRILFCLSCSHLKGGNSDSDTGAVNKK